MQKPTDSSSSAASAETPLGFTQSKAARPNPPVATFRQYLEGPAETFEMARRKAQAATRNKSGGASDTEARQLFAH